MTMTTTMQPGALVPYTASETRLLESAFNSALDVAPEVPVTIAYVMGDQNLVCHSAIRRENGVLQIRGPSGYYGDLVNGWPILRDIQVDSGAAKAMYEAIQNVLGTSAATTVRLGYLCDALGNAFSRVHQEQAAIGGMVANVGDMVSQMSASQGQTGAMVSQLGAQQATLYDAVGRMGTQQSSLYDAVGLVGTQQANLNDAVGRMGTQQQQIGNLITQVDAQQRVITGNQGDLFRQVESTAAANRRSHEEFAAMQVRQAVSSARRQAVERDLAVLQHGAGQAQADVATLQLELRTERENAAKLRTRCAELEVASQQGQEHLRELHGAREEVRNLRQAERAQAIEAQRRESQLEGSQQRCESITQLNNELRHTNAELRTRRREADVRTQEAEGRRQEAETKQKVSEAEALARATELQKQIDELKRDRPRTRRDEIARLQGMHDDLVPPTRQQLQEVQERQDQLMGRSLPPSSAASSPPVSPVVETRTTRVPRQAPRPRPDPVMPPSTTGSQRPLDDLYAMVREQSKQIAQLTAAVTAMCTAPVVVPPIAIPQPPARVPQPAYVPATPVAKENDPFLPPAQTPAARQQPTADQPSTVVADRGRPRRTRDESFLTWGRNLIRAAGSNGLVESQSETSGDEDAASDESEVSTPRSGKTSKKRRARVHAGVTKDRKWYTASSPLFEDVQSVGNFETFLAAVDEQGAGQACDAVEHTDFLPDPNYYIKRNRHLLRLWANGVRTGTRDFMLELGWNLYYAARMDVWQVKNPQLDWPTIRAKVTGDDLSDRFITLVKKSAKKQSSGGRKRRPYYGSQQKSKNAGSAANVTAITGKPSAAPNGGKKSK